MEGLEAILAAGAATEVWGGRGTIGSSRGGPKSSSSSSSSSSPNLVDTGEVFTETREGGWWWGWWWWGGGEEEIPGTDTRPPATWTLRGSSPGLS